jgi:G6PDH family F420-dependent oxidoreductase
VTVRYGYTLSSEEHPPGVLAHDARTAEERGFDFVSVSDHFHPWVDAQGESPFVWTTLGAVAATTSRIGLGVGVTCPILRVHPAIVAQAAATTAALSGGRFFLGLGTGELLNEHVLGQKWPRIEIRREMLAEAVEIIRALWTGEDTDFDGRYFTVENARLYTLPEEPPPIVLSAFGPASARTAAESGCDLWCTHPDPEVVAAYRDSGGRGEVIGQLTLCWAADRDAAIDTMHRVWPTAGLGGQLSQELPSPALFEQATAKVSRDDIAAQGICGPDIGPVVEGLEEFADAGFTAVHLHQVGADQDGFFDFWADEVRPAL